MNGLDIVENRIKSLIQKSAVFFPWTNKNTELMSRLVETIQNVLLDKFNPGKNIPSRFTLKMNAKNAQHWFANPGMKQDLITAYNAILVEYGIKQNYFPDFSVSTQDSLLDDEIFFEASDINISKDKTSSIVSSPKTVESSLSLDPSPVLLFGEDKEIKLISSVITIGRRECNDIVIDDIRISRLHAQIRKVPEGYMIFDTGSTSGTFINNSRISQKLLHTGDVISLGGYKFIFLDDIPRISESHQMEGESETC
jgi:hypothetical protein